MQLCVSQNLEKEIYVFLWRRGKAIIYLSNIPQNLYEHSTTQKTIKEQIKVFYNCLYPRISLWPGKPVAICEVPLQIETKLKYDVVAHTRRLSKELERKCKNSIGQTFSRNAVQEVVQQTDKPYTAAILLEL